MNVRVDGLRNSCRQGRRAQQRCSAAQKTSPVHRSSHARIISPAATCVIHAIRYSQFMSINRRTFLGGLLSSPLGAAYQRAAQTAPSMRIRRIETVYWKSREDAPFWPHWTWLRIDTDSGLSGIGETYPRNTNEAAAIHGVASS